MGNDWPMLRRRKPGCRNSLWHWPHQVHPESLFDRGQNFAIPEEGSTPMHLYRQVIDNVNNQNMKSVKKHGTDWHQI
jgi:hypothetical protein